MYYVTMTDVAMSGWGIARGKENKLVLECDSFQEAFNVYLYCKGHNSMRYVNIASSKPYYNKEKFVVSRHNKEDYPRFYETARKAELIKTTITKEV